MRIAAALAVMAMAAGPARADGGLYATPSFYVGGGTIDVGTASRLPALTLRNAVGITGDRNADFSGRGGLTLDITSAPLAFRDAVLLGVEAQIDWKVTPCWHVGPRLATTLPSSNNVGIAMLGVRARTDTLSLGIDFAYTAGSGPEAPTGVNVLAGIGFEGKVGAIATGVEAGLFLIFVALVFEALSHQGT